jgi:hypothetical protein
LKDKIKMDFSNNYGGLYDFSAKVPFYGMPQATPLGAFWFLRHKLTQIKNLTRVNA